MLLKRKKNENEKKNKMKAKQKQQNIVDETSKKNKKVVTKSTNEK